jgi:hypothetical protein
MSDVPEEIETPKGVFPKGAHVSMSFRGYCMKLSDLRLLLNNPPSDLVD